jgi:hypothetical protein
MRGAGRRDVAVGWLPGFLRTVSVWCWIISLMRAATLPPWLGRAKLVGNSVRGLRTTTLGYGPPKKGSAQESVGPHATGQLPLIVRQQGDRD